MPVIIRVKRGTCQEKRMMEGQEFVVDVKTPEGICLDAWNSITPYLNALRYDGNFPWEKKKGVVTLHCPDPNGILFEMKRIEKSDDGDE